MDNLLTETQAAQMINTTVHNLRRRVFDGEIRATRLPNGDFGFHPHDLERAGLMRRSMPDDLTIRGDFGFHPPDLEPAASMPDDPTIRGTQLSDDDLEYEPPDVERADSMPADLTTRGVLYG